MFISASNNSNEKFVEILEDGTKINNSENLNQTRKFDGLDITNIKFYYVKEGMTIIEFEAINETDIKYGGNKILLNVLNENNSLIQTIIGVIPEIDAGKSEKLTFSIDKDIVNAYDLSLEIYNDSDYEI